MSKTAVLVIDLQNEYLPTGKLPLVGIEEATNQAVKVISHAREIGTQVIHVKHVFANGEMPAFEPNSDGIKFQHAVSPLKGEEVVTKNKVNSFLDTNLKDILDKNGIQQVIVVGAMTQMCVDAVVRAASDYGYKVKVVHDACATMDLEFNGTTVPAAHVHATLMAAFKFAYAEVLSTDEIIA